MNRNLFFITVGSLLLAVALPGMAGAIQMVLEVDPHKFLSEEAPGLKKCDNLHQTTGDCICCNWHVEGASEAANFEPDPTGKAGSLIGTRLQLRSVNETIVVRVNRITPLYRLDSGATFTPAGTWNPHDANGEQWNSEHAGVNKSRVVTAWIDANGDGLVGVSDELMFDNGEPSKIVNVGIGLHVTTEESSRSVPARRPQQQ